MLDTSVLFYQAEWTLVLGILVCVFAAAAFSFINGFHDTANAVTTVIYTRAMPPIFAVVWSGIWNFMGTWFGGVAVAMSFISLFPTYLVSEAPPALAFLLLACVLSTALFWNLFTWYKGIPCTSSHTLMGALIGGSIGFSFAFGQYQQVDWKLISDMTLAMIISPAFGFSAVILLISIFRIFIQDHQIYETPKENTPPPFWIRIILIITSTGVSLFHGSNDGQKGIGMIMIILISFLPSVFTLNPSIEKSKIADEISIVLSVLKKYENQNFYSNEIESAIHGADKLAVILKVDDSTLPSKLFWIKNRLQNLSQVLSSSGIQNHKKIAATDKARLKQSIDLFQKYTTYVPVWVIGLISLSIGIGTMVGWRRIVITVGEKIGKSHLTYLQATASEIIAASTVGLTTSLGLPVSTTHILSSGIAGGMVASDGTKNLQTETVKSILITWILTLPITILLSAVLFIFFNWLLNFFNFFY